MPPSNPNVRNSRPSRQPWSKRSSLLQTALGIESDAALAGHRRLLTEQGEPLAEAVAKALELLGFKVEDMDERFSVEKREDFRVSDHEKAWTAIVEVKGYAKAGKPSDFTKFIRYSGLYARDEKQPPEACWYVINAYFGQQPASRPGPFDSARDAVAAFAESPGLVLPTSELFKLVRDVEADRLSKDAARESLMGANGIYALDQALPDTAAGI